jgi:hypothetical protein
MIFINDLFRGRENIQNLSSSSCFDNFIFLNFHLFLSTAVNRIVDFLINVLNIILRLSLYKFCSLRLCFGTHRYRMLAMCILISMNQESISYLEGHTL